MNLFEPKGVPDALIDSWSVFDWRENPFAPQFSILQAKLHTGETVSGGGGDRASAFAKALGETAEILAVSSYQRKKPLDQVENFCSLTDGLAADIVKLTAQQRAVLEAVERAAVWDWWEGVTTALLIHPNDPSVAKVTEEVRLWRQGNIERRSTELALLPSITGMVTIVARSKSNKQASSVLGFGTAQTVSAAASKATHELLLMELNYAELLAASVVNFIPEFAELQQKFTNLDAHLADLMSFTRADDRKFLPTSKAHAGALTSKIEQLVATEKVILNELTQNDGPMFVFSAKFTENSRRRARQYNTPFF